MSYNLGWFLRCQTYQQPYLSHICLWLNQLRPHLRWLSNHVVRELVGSSLLWYPADRKLGLLDERSQAKILCKRMTLRQLGQCFVEVLLDFRHYLHFCTCCKNSILRYFSPFEGMSWFEFYFLKKWRQLLTHLLQQRKFLSQQSLCKVLLGHGEE